MSSEMVLGQLLAQNNELMTTKFYYSTEMRVLSIQLVFALCFKLFRDWHVIRMVVMVCLWVIFDSWHTTFYAVRWNAENIFCSQHSCCLHLFQAATLNLCWWRRAISHMWQLRLRHWP